MLEPVKDRYTAMARHQSNVESPLASLGEWSKPRTDADGVEISEIIPRVVWVIYKIFVKEFPH